MDSRHPLAFRIILITLLVFCAFQDILALETEVFPEEYTLRNVQYSDETCQQDEVISICLPHKGRVPKLMDCKFGPLSETPTNESFYSFGLGNVKTYVIFNFGSRFVKINKVILHHYCARTSINQLPSIWVQKGFRSVNLGLAFYNLEVSVRGERSSVDGDYLRITCEQAGQRGYTTLTIHPDNRGPFTLLKLSVNVGMGTFELSEVQFFIEDTSNSDVQQLAPSCSLNGDIIPITLSPPPTTSSASSPPTSRYSDTGGSHSNSTIDIIPWGLAAVFATLSVILSVAFTVTLIFLVKYKKQALALSGDSKSRPTAKFEMEENVSYAHCGRQPRSTTAAEGSGAGSQVYEFIS